MTESMKKAAVAAAAFASALAGAAHASEREFLPSPPPVAGGTAMDGIAARVDAAVITMGDVMAEIRSNPRWRTGVNLADKIEFHNLYKRVTEALVDRKLVLKAADNAKLELQEWAVDSRIQEIVRDFFDGDVNRLNAKLAEDKVPYGEFRRTIREDLIASAMRYQIVDKNATASPGAMRAEYRDHPERYSNAEKVTISVILLAPAEGSPAPAERAAALLEKLSAGADFAELARENSSDTHASSGGLWEDVDPNEYFLPEIVAHISALKPGETSAKPLVFGDYAVIVRKISGTPGRKRSFSEAYDDIERNVLAAERERIETQWLESLRKSSFVQMFDLPKERVRVGD